MILNKAKIAFHSKFSSSTRRISIGLGFIKALRASLSILSIVLSAKYFGTSLERDSWLIGGSIIAVLLQFLFGPLNETFRTKFIHLREEVGEEIAANSTASLLVTISLVAFIIALLSFCFSDLLSQLFASGFSVEQKKVLELMIKILLPSLIILEVTNIWTAVLNAYNSFYIPDLFSFFSLIVNLLLIIILAPLIGIYSLIVSSYISSIILIIILYKQLKRVNHAILVFSLPNWGKIKPFVLFSFPFYINYAFSQADIIVEKSLTTKMGVGSISILDYARRFTDLPINTSIAVVTTVLTPVISLHFIKNNIQDIYSEIQKYFRMISFALIPLTVIFIVLPKELIELILVRGAFTDSNVAITASALRWFGLSLFSTGMYIVYTQALIAQKKVYLFSIFVIISYALKITFNFLCYKTFNIQTFPISNFLCQFMVGSLMLLCALPSYRSKVIKEAVRVFVVLFAVTIAAYLTHKIIGSHFTQNKFCIISLVLLSIAFSEILLIYIIGFDEKNFIRRVFAKKSTNLNKT